MEYLDIYDMLESIVLENKNRKHELTDVSYVREVYSDNDIVSQYLTDDFMTLAEIVRTLTMLAVKYCEFFDA